jgi:cytochrome P450
VGDVNVKAGETIVLALGAGNRDPRHFECRPSSTCIGAPRLTTTASSSARATARATASRAPMHAAAASLVERVRLRPDPDRDPPSWRGTFLQSWVPLHALVTAR